MRTLLLTGRQQCSRMKARTASLPVVAAMSAATRSPAPASRTARVTSAPAPTSARAVSTPMPDEAPVTIARLPARSMPPMTSAAVESKRNGVVNAGHLGQCALLLPAKAPRAGTPTARPSRPSVWEQLRKRLGDGHDAKHGTP
jgi:hypothetical protein